MSRSLGTLAMQRSHFCLEKVGMESLALKFQEFLQTPEPLAMLGSLIQSGHSSCFAPFGCVWKWLVPQNPMVLLIIIPIKWLLLGILTQHFQTNPFHTRWSILRTWTSKMIWPKFPWWVDLCRGLADGKRSRTIPSSGSWRCRCRAVCPGDVKLEIWYPLRGEKGWYMVKIMETKDMILGRVWNWVVCSTCCCNFEGKTRS